MVNIIMIIKKGAGRRSTVSAAKKLRIKGGGVVDVGSIWSNLNRLAELIRISFPSPPGFEVGVGSRSYPGGEEVKF